MSISKSVVQHTLPKAVYIHVYRAGDDDYLEGGAEGSGYIISADGYIVTNAHVVKQAQGFAVELFDGTMLPATLVGKCKNVDVAVLKVETDQPLPYVDFSNEGDTEVGDDVFAIGMPITTTIKRTVTYGRVSHTKRFGTWKGLGPFPLVQADISLGKGSSGGGMFNANGQLVGMNTFILDAQFSLSSGFSFALRAPDIKRIVAGIIKTGYGPWKRRFGATVKECTTAMAKAHKQAAPTGVVLNSIAEGGLAEKLGLKVGDLVLNVGEVAVECPSSVAYALMMAEGQKTSIKVSRIGVGEVELPLNLPNRGKYRKTKMAPIKISGNFDAFGFELTEVSGGGVNVATVRPGSIASVEGFLGGELILAVQDNTTGEWLETNSVSELNRILNASAKDGLVLKVDDCGAEVLMAISA